MAPPRPLSWPSQLSSFIPRLSPLTRSQSRSSSEGIVVRRNDAAFQNTLHRAGSLGHAIAGPPYLGDAMFCYVLANSSLSQNPPQHFLSVLLTPAFAALFIKPEGSTSRRASFFRRKVQQNQAL
jgi:hypothetical protein